MYFETEIPLFFWDEYRLWKVLCESTDLSIAAGAFMSNAGTSFLFAHRNSLMISILVCTLAGLPTMRMHCFPLCVFFRYLSQLLSKGITEHLCTLLSVIIL